MLLSVLYIGFSDSRTSALMLCAGCGAYFLFTQIQSADKKDRTKRGIAGGLMIAAAVILVFSGMHLMKKCIQSAAGTCGRKYAGGGSGSRNHRRYKPGENRICRRTSAMAGFSSGKAVLRSGRHLRYMEQGIPRWWIMQRRT